MHDQHENKEQGLTDPMADDYRALYQKGSQLLMPYINLHDRGPTAAPNREAELREGIRLLQRVVALEPRSWPAHWLIGKAHQALDDHASACEAFRQATRLCQNNPDVPRELCLECLHLGHFKEAIEAARLAVRIDPSDPGLQANLSLALLLAGDIDEAFAQAEQAVARSPQDEINGNLLAIIQEVREGRRRQPASLAELEG